MERLAYRMYNSKTRALFPDLSLFPTLHTNMSVFIHLHCLYRPGLLCGGNLECGEQRGGDGQKVGEEGKKGERTTTTKADTENAPARLSFKVEVQS